MQTQGVVQNGTIVIDGGLALPDGTRVIVSISPAPESNEPKSPSQRVQLPLVHCDQPGSVHLTNEGIAEILDAEDAAPRR